MPKQSGIIPVGQSTASYVTTPTSLPEFDENRHHSVVFDGHIHNRDELRNSLDDSNAQNQSDASIVLNAYRRWEEKAFRLIRGSFAFVLWDGTNESLFAVRDATGSVPLFYGASSGRILFTSSVEELLAQPSMSTDLNRCALASHLLDIWQSAEETYFSAIRRVPAGHFIRVHPSGHDIVRYWDPIASSTATKWNTSETTEHFEILFKQAIRRCMNGDAPAIFLSGGLDSVSVAAASAEETARQSKSPPLALSLAFPDDRGVVEQVVQRNVATALGMPHVIRGFEDTLGPHGLLLAALELSRRSPAPLLNRADPAYLSLGKEGRSRGCDVVLTGGGGDDWLTVSPTHAADLLSSGNILGLVRYFNTMRRSQERPAPALFWQLMWSSGLRSLLRAANRRLLQIEDPPVFREQYRKRFLKSLPVWLAPEDDLRKELADRAEFRLIQQFDGSHYQRGLRGLLDHPLESMRQEELFESGRRIGIRMARPYWEADLVEFLISIPPSAKMQGGMSKALLRPLLIKHFSELQLERQKKIDGPGLQRYVSAENWSHAWDSLGGTPILHQIGVVDSKALEPVVSSLLGSSSVMRERHLWGILNLEAWAGSRV